MGCSVRLDKLPSFNLLKCFPDHVLDDPCAFDFELTAQRGYCVFRGRTELPESIYGFDAYPVILVLQTLDEYGHGVLRRRADLSQCLRRSPADLVLRVFQTPDQRGDSVLCGWSNPPRCVG